MPLTQEERDAIVDAAFSKTKEEFAQTVSQRTSLTTAEVMALAKTGEERKAFAAVLAEVTKASASNTKKADAIRNIQGGVEVLVKFAGLLV